MLVSISPSPNHSMTKPLDHVTFSITTSSNITSYNNANVTDSVSHRPSSGNIECRIIDWLDSVLPPLLFTVGLISNTLVILVMKSKFFRSTSTAFYMIANAATDFLCLLVALPTHYLYVNFPSNFKSFHGYHWVCSVFNVIGWGTSDLGIYFTVAMTIDRAIAVWKPLKSHKYCTKRRAKVIMIVFTLFEMIKLSPLAVKSRVVGANTKTQLCDIDRSDPDFEYFHDVIWSWFHVATLILCYVLAAGGNCAIVYFVRKASENRRRLYSTVRRNEKTVESRQAAQSQQISIMLVIDSVTLIICTLPFALVNLLSINWRFLLTSTDGKNLPFTLSFYLLYINRCLNLFLYCVSGERFRRAMKSVICCASSKPPLSGRHAHGTRAHRNESNFSERDERDGASNDFRQTHPNASGRPVERELPSTHSLSPIVNSPAETQSTTMSSISQIETPSNAGDSLLDITCSRIFMMSSPMLSPDSRKANGNALLGFDFELDDFRESSRTRGGPLNEDSLSISTRFQRVVIHRLNSESNSMDIKMEELPLNVESFLDGDCKKDTFKLYYRDLFYV